MDKCIAVIKSGPRKGEICGATKKIVDIIDGKEIPHCNRHKIKENKEKLNTDSIDILSKKKNKSLKIEEREKSKEDNERIEIDNNILKEENSEYDNFDSQNILGKIDKQLDELFNEYGL